MTQKEMMVRRRDMMPSKLYLYRDGDECVDVTGGWESVPNGIGTWIGLSKYDGVLEKQDTKMVLSVSKFGSFAANCETVKTIDFSQFSSLHCIAKAHRFTNMEYMTSFGYGKKDVNADRGTLIDILNEEYQEYILPIHTTDEQAVRFLFCTYRTETASITIKKVWLE